MAMSHWRSVAGARQRIRESTLLFDSVVSEHHSDHTANEEYTMELKLSCCVCSRSIIASSLEAKGVHLAQVQARVHEMLTSFGDAATCARTDAHALGANRDRWWSSSILFTALGDGTAACLDRGGGASGSPPPHSPAQLCMPRPSASHPSPNGGAAQGVRGGVGGTTARAWHCDTKLARGPSDAQSSVGR